MIKIRSFHPLYSEREDVVVGLSPLPYLPDYGGSLVQVVQGVDVLLVDGGQFLRILLTVLL